MRDMADATEGPSFTTYADGSKEISLPTRWAKGETTDFLITPTGEGHVYTECGNCCGTASEEMSPESLRALRDFLNEHVKD